MCKILSALNIIVGIIFVGFVTFNHIDPVAIHEYLWLAIDIAIAVLLFASAYFLSHEH